MTIWILLVLSFVTVGNDIVGAQPVPLGEFPTLELCEEQRVNVLHNPQVKDSFNEHLAAIGCLKKEK